MAMFETAENLDERDRAAELAWARLERRGAPSVPSDLAEGVDDGVEEYLEALALLAQGLPSEPLPAGARDRLLARVRGELAPTRPATSPVLPFTPPGRRSFWVPVLAAALLAATAGLAILQARVHRRDAEIARSASRLDMVQRIARQAYRLEGVQSAALPAGGAGKVSPDRVEGIVYVCGHHQRFLLSLQGAPPAPAGSEYRLWFVTDHGEVDGGPLAEADQRLEREEMHMPEGTRGFLISLEPARTGGVGGGGPLGELIVRSKAPVKL